MKNVKVVAAIILDNNKIFATQRGYGEFKDGWEFPGGKIEEGETPEEALVREISEELDTKIRVDEKVETPEYVTVTINDEFVESGTFDTTVLKDGDTVEFLYFMGGGQ